jgi:2-methylcitrate dehydratase PrpD
MNRDVGSIAQDLAGWACWFAPRPADLELADRSLADTVAVALAARDHPVTALAGVLDEGGRWAAAGHVLDFDDLHLESTSHVSVVCVPAVLSAGGGARAYLAAAGVMARLGNALGWKHYAAGWHATCTAGALGAAAGAAVALGLSAPRIATAIALAVPGAGGVQRAFGTDAKSMQVGFAVDAGVRAARLAAAGAQADPAAVDDWFGLVGGSGTLDLTGPAVPGGLAIKVYPCCYALQRPISALRQLPLADLDAERIIRIVVRTPEATLQPLIHHRPSNALEGKFSLEYALAATILDGRPGLESFTDDAVARPPARELLGRVEVVAEPGGDGLLDGEAQIEVALDDGSSVRTALAVPPGAPDRPPTHQELGAKIADCAGDLAEDVSALGWGEAAEFLREWLPPARPGADSGRRTRRRRARVRP